MIVLTIDTDWAPDWATKTVLEKVRSLGIKTTIFFSTPSPVEPWANLETGCHPDLSKKSLSPGDLDGDPETRSEERVLERYRELFPEARAIRTHRFYWHSDLSRRLAGRGFTIDSSMILPFQPHLRGFRVGRLSRFPVWSSDHLHLARSLSCRRLEMPNFDQPGLKIFCFHVAYLYLNASSLDEFNMIKEGLEQPGDRIRGSARPGVWNLFELLAEKVYASSTSGLWLSELSAALEM